MASFQVTIDWMNETYDKYNKLYWEDKLRKPNFRITKNKSWIGLWSTKKWELSLSTLFDLDEHRFTETLLHEMCHQYIRQNKIKDTRTHHGKKWFAEANRINKLGGWDIARCTDISGLGYSEDKNVTFRIMSVLNEKGQFFQSVINPKYEDYFTNWANKNSWFVKYVFFDSTDEKTFASYSKCYHALRGDYINAETFEKYCEIARRQANGAIYDKMETVKKVI